MTLGVVLAGGSSTRMGRPKTELAFEGRTFLDRVASALCAVTGEVLVVGDTRTAPWPGVADEGGPGRGPLSGIVTALARGDILVVGVDHPQIEAGTLRHLAALGDDRPVIPVDEGVPQVTCAWYPSTVRGRFADELARGGFVRRALDDLDVRWVLDEEWRSWGETGASWSSIDTPAAYSRLVGD